MTSVTSSSAEGGIRRNATKLDKIVALVLAVAFVIIGGWDLFKSLSPADKLPSSIASVTDPAKKALMEDLMYNPVGLGPGGRRILANYLRGNIDVNEPLLGRTLLDAATQADLPDMVTELLRRGANPNQRSLGMTPLWSACLYHKYQIAEILLDHGADVNELTWSRWSPLSVAISDDGSPALIKLLLAHGANVNFIDPDGTSQLDLALQRKDSSGKIIVGIIEAAGGRTHKYQPRR